MLKNSLYSEAVVNEHLLWKSITSYGMIEQEKSSISVELHADLTMNRRDNWFCSMDRKLNQVPLPKNLLLCTLKELQLKQE